jgi:hypothetical protein
MSARNRWLSGLVALSTLGALGALLPGRRRTAIPQLPLSTNGPDVICGDINSPANYNVVGTWMPWRWARPRATSATRS